MSEGQVRSLQYRIEELEARCIKWKARAEAAEARGSLK